MDQPRKKAFAGDTLAGRDADARAAGVAGAGVSGPWNDGRRDEHRRRAHGPRSGGRANAGNGSRGGNGIASGGGLASAPGGAPLIIAVGPIDRRSALGALGGAALFFALAYLSMALARFDDMLPAVWVANAAAVAFLLRARLANELGLCVAILVASLLANMLNGSDPGVALVFAVANLASILVVTGLTRRWCGPAPDMASLSTLAKFVFIGGGVGPLISASIAALSLGPWPLFAHPAAAPQPWITAWDGIHCWFLTDSMGMILIVPTALLIGDALIARNWPAPVKIAECAGLMAVTLVCMVLLFGHNSQPLLFLILPITLLHAFRLGSVGTALHVMLVAGVASAMTWAGHGPIVEASVSLTTRTHLIQAFMAANFLTGLPVAAVLAGRQRLFSALSEGRRELALLTNGITDAVMKIDLDGVCTYASPSVQDVMGRDPGDVLGKKPTMLAPVESRQRLLDAFERLVSGQSDRERFTYRRWVDDADGMPVFIEADCAVTFDPVTGTREGVLVCARDVTERVELELLLTRARQHAEKAARAKSDFLANMSHEIRTPMNGVLGFAELMLQGELDLEQRRHAEMIVQSGRTMMLLLNDILDLSKIEAGQITIHPGPVDLHTTLDECIAMHRQTARRKGLTVRLECESDAEDASRHAPIPEQACARCLPTVLVDGLRLRQIVLNLVGNAIKFTASGAVRVSYRVSEDHLCVTVRDTGIGISPARLDTIFRPFTQGESDTARRYGGTGLGLSISRQLAELLGGWIEVESVPGEGSSFALTLPATLVTPEPAAPEQTETALPEDLPNGARILVAEDHDVNRELITEMLTRCGLNVAIAQDGNEAISMVIDSILRTRPYDLVLMDVQMPECDGYSATRAIREEGIGPKLLPIIALTANAFPEDVAKARAAGMQAHLAKPIVFADLARALQRWLPTRIVEAPMDRDLAPGAPVEETASTPGPDDDAASAGATPDAASPNPAPSPTPSPAPSPALVARWRERRSEAIEAVRIALAAGLMRDTAQQRALTLADRKALIRQLHKLAGTAGTFGEPELGERAATLEHALATGQPPEDCENLAFDLVALADEPESAHTGPGNGRS